MLVAELLLIMLEDLTIPRPCFIVSGMDKVADRLDAINKTLCVIADAMPKRENRATRFLKTVVLLGAALGLVNIVDTILRWITGG